MRFAEDTHENMPNFFGSVWSAIKRITKYLTGLNEQLIGIKREQSNDQKWLNWIQD